MTGRWKLAAAFLPVVVYLSLALPLLRSPGLHIDEAADGLAASAVGAPFRWGEDWPDVDGRLRIGDRLFPLTEGPYHGGFTPYLLWPAYKIFGATTLTLRLASAAIAAAILWLFFTSCRFWFGTGPALAAGLLLATDPVWAQYSRVLFHREEILLQLPWWTFWWAATSYARERAPWRLGVAGLALGLGLSMKITFLWYLTGLGLLLAVPSARGAALPARPDRRAWTLAAAGALAGLSFMIVFNVLEPGVTVKHLWNALFHPSLLKDIDSTVDNFDFGRNLWLRLGQMPGLLMGRVPYSADWGFRPPRPFWAWTRFLANVAILSGAFALGVLRRGRPGARAFLALTVVYLGVVLWTPFTLSDFDRGHLTILFPFPQIAAGALLAVLSGRRRTLAAWALGGLLLFNASQNVAAAREMSRNGGRGRWCQSIDELARTLDAERIRRPVTFGWGLSETVAYLTERRVTPLVLPELKEGRLDESAYADAVQDGRLVYVWMGTIFESRELKAAFEEKLRLTGAKTKLERVIADRSGRPAYWIYSARLPAAADRAPRFP